MSGEHFKAARNSYQKARPAAEFTQDELARCIDVTRQYIMAPENESRAGLPISCAISVLPSGSKVLSKFLFGLYS